MNFTWYLVTWPNGKRLRLGVEGDTVRVVLSEDLTRNQRTLLLGRSAKGLLSEFEGVKITMHVERIEEVDEHGKPK